MTLMSGQYSLSVHQVHHLSCKVLVDLFVGSHAARNQRSKISEKVLFVSVKNILTISYNSTC